MGCKYFEDIAVGERLDCESVLMTKESIIEFAKKFDPQPFHIDEMSANESIFKLNTVTAICWLVKILQNIKPQYIE